MIDKILIYEVHYSNFNRYVIPFAEDLIKNNITKDVVMVYDSFVEVDKISKDYSKDISISGIKQHYKLLKKQDNSNVLFINYSYRITDLYWTYKLKKIGVTCYQQQHGMYAEFLERSFLGYFSALNRKWIYLKYMFFFLLSFNFGIFLYLLNKDFIKSLKINSFLGKNYLKAISVTHSNHVLVWGDYWKEWFIENHFYTSLDQFTTIGNPDYHVFIKDQHNEKNRDKICYIAQTFVEDGRMDRINYKNVIDKISDEFKEKLYIKMHPRSDKSIFKKVLENGGELRYDFPITGHYIGHYSSLLALAINEDAKVYLLEINNEQIPSYFINSANEVFSNVENLINAINSDKNSKSDKEISYYFENKEKHPYEIIRNKIINSIA